MKTRHYDVCIDVASSWEQYIEVPAVLSGKKLEEFLKSYIEKEHGHPKDSIQISYACEVDEEQAACNK